MKQMITAVIIIAVVTIAVATNATYMTRSIADILDLMTQLPQSEEEFGDGSDAGEVVAKISERWDNAHPFLDLSLLVIESSTVSLLISDLTVYCETGEFTDFHASAERLRIMLDRLSESEKLSFKSIL